MQADRQAYLRGLPIWRGEIAIELLPGGLSNESYVVTDQSGKHVARFGEDYPFHDVFRDRNRWPVAQLS